MGYPYQPLELVKSLEMGCAHCEGQPFERPSCHVYSPPPQGERMRGCLYPQQQTLHYAQPNLMDEDFPAGKSVQTQPIGFFKQRNLLACIWPFHEWQSFTHKEGLPYGLRGSLLPSSHATLFTRVPQPPVWGLWRLS